MAYDKKKKKGYRKGAIVGTSEYSKRAYKKGGVVGTSDYSKHAYQDGGIVKQYSKKRKGYSDHGDGQGSHKGAPRNSSTQVIKGREYGKRKGYGDHEGSRVSFSNIGGNAGNKEKFSIRPGWNDHGVEHAYEDGGVVQSRLNALEDLRDQMAAMGGEALSKFNPKAYEDGGIVESEDGEDESKSESSINLDDLSRDQLIELLKNR